MNTLNSMVAIAWKDLLGETRSRETVLSVLVFAILSVLIFNFALGGTRESLRTSAPGILWVTFAFSGILSLNRAFMPEKENGCIDGLLAAPVSRDAIYLGKMLAALTLTLVVEMVVLLLFAVMFDVTLSPLLVLITFMTTVGFVSVGTLFSALAINTRAREMVLPILFLPVAVPLLIAAVRATDEVLGGGGWPSAAGWIQIIGAFDAIFLVVSFLIFGFVIEE